jgi:hypothetical protein
MSWEITTADVAEWAEGYTGPKFHALFCDPNYVFSERKSFDRSRIHRAARAGPSQAPGPPSFMGNTSARRSPGMAARAA